MLRARERLAIQTVLPTLTTAWSFIALEKSFSPLETVAPDGLATGRAGGDIVLLARSFTLFEPDRESVRRKSSANWRVESQGADSSISFFGPDFDIEWLLVGKIWDGGFGRRWRIDGHIFNGLGREVQAQGWLKVMLAGAILIRQVDEWKVESYKVCPRSLWTVWKRWQAPQERGWRSREVVTDGGIYQSEGRHCLSSSSPYRR